MATEKWTAATSRGNVLSTELNALANGSYSAVGSVLDNSVNLDRFGIAELAATWASAPTDKAVLDLFAVPAIDATNYADGGGAVRPSNFLYLGSFQVRAVTTAQRVVCGQFTLPPFKHKYVLLNSSGFALPATGSVVSLWTFNRAVN